MYTIDLDLHLNFSPPMHTDGRGLVLTRSISLPFPAYEGFVFTNRGTEQGDQPLGLMLHNVMWDTDRDVFLADVYFGHAGTFDEIVPIIRRWHRRGWAFGSYRAGYSQPDDHLELPDVSDAVSERMPTRPPKWRPPAFNALVKALVRHLVEGYEDGASAFAMDQTGMYFEGRDEGDNKGISANEATFIKAKEKYRKMTEERREAWEAGMSKYASLQNLALGRTPPRTCTRRW